MKSLEELQVAQYSTNSNIFVEYTDSVRNCAAIYFTSNSLFYPHTAEDFQRAVIEKDRYEWTKLKLNRAQKHIFVRDIYKQWYGIGVNAEINSMDKLISKLKDETNDYNEIVTIGSSGGGYAATLIGVQLKASMILNFNGQWEINSAIENNGDIISPILKKMQDEQHPGVKYFNIATPEYDSDKIFYFVSKLSKWDKKQLACIGHFKKVNIITFFNNHHGIPFFKSSLPKLLNSDYATLQKYKDSAHLPFFFDCQVAGFIVTVEFLFRLIKKKWF